jgi:predicted phage-related endonuclease
MELPACTKPYESRNSFIGGSDARIIRNRRGRACPLMAGEKGEPEPEDLSGNLIVQLGSATEELNRSWYERNTGWRVRDAQRRVRHSAIAWMVATLDGIVEGTEAVFESKFMLPWSFSEEVAAEKYMDPLYLSVLVSAEKKFWRCVQSGEVPHLVLAEPPRPRIEAVRIVDMSASNSWAELSSATPEAPFSTTNGPKASSKP